MGEGEKVTGVVIQAFGNLLHVRFTGHIRQGEIAYALVSGQSLMGEVIEISDDIAKIQVFEDTRGIRLNTPIHFAGHLLEAELGPGLLQSIFDGLQNPLERVAEVSGLFLQRGVYLPPLDRKKKWLFHPTARPGDLLSRGDSLGWTIEGRFHHQIMVPFSLHGQVRVVHVMPEGEYHVDEEVARGIDLSGRELIFTMIQRWPVKNALIEGNKIRSHRMMTTGLRIIDTQFPVAKGGTFCSPGPFGAGKTMMQHHLSKYCDVDIVVIVACGERAGEVVEVLRTFPDIIDPHTNEPLMNRTVLICNTSSMPVAAREASVYMGTAIAEYYRQMGLDVLLLADSTSRWAQAMREMSGRLEEIPGEEAFPAYLASRIASFYERSGTIQLRNARVGSLTIGGSVSPAGGNFEEPVTQASLSVVGAFLGLSRSRSDARRYPAIDPLISWSKYMRQAGAQLEERLPGWSEKIEAASVLLCRGDERMEVVGEDGVALEDLIIFLKSELYEITYLQQNTFDSEDRYFSIERQIESFRLIQTIFDAHFYFDTHDEARSYFLNLQNEVKNLNYLSFRSDRYADAIHRVKKMIDTKRAVHS
jgi:V/A-type H+-transporting ATPase subunit A